VKTIILMASLLSAFIVYSQENSNAAKIMEKITFETDIGYFKAFAPSEIQDFMENEGLYLEGGGGWFNPPWISAPRIDNERYFMYSILVGYELRNHFETGLFYHSGDKSKVIGEYDGTYELDASCDEFLLGAYFRYHISVFEFQAGPSFQFVTAQTGEPEKMDINRQTLPGISGGLNLEIPQRQSLFDFVIGYKYNYFFNKINIGPYELSKTNPNGVPITYTLPRFEANANCYSIYIGLRINIQNFEKN
jgi:hypothetical protein